MLPAESPARTTRLVSIFKSNFSGLFKMNSVAFMQSSIGVGNGFSGAI
jgi:hypothetical protein